MKTSNSSITRKGDSVEWPRASRNAIVVYERSPPERPRRSWRGGEGEEVRRGP